MTEYAGTQATRHAESVKSTPPTSQTRGSMPAATALPSTRDIGVYPRSLPPLGGSGAGSNNNTTCSTRHDFDPSAAGNVNTTAAMGATFPTSSFRSTLTDRDPSRGPSLLRVSDPAPPPLTPTAPATTAPTLSGQHVLHCPRKPAASTGGPRMPVCLTSASVQSHDENDACPHSQSTGEGDEAAPRSSQRACSPAPTEDYANQHADRRLARTVEQGPRRGEATPRLHAAPSRSDNTEVDLLARQFVQRTVLWSSICNCASGGESPARCRRDELVKSTVRTVSVGTGSGACSHEATATVPIFSTTAAKSSQSCVGILNSANVQSSHRDETENGTAGSFPLTRANNPALSTRETFPIPRCCPDDLLRGDGKMWTPGKPLRIAYVTWNMASKRPRTGEVSAHCIYPNAHLVVVGTQENGPYVMSNKHQRRWTKIVSQACLGGQYELVCQHHMWAVQMLVFARRRDVAHYISRAHASHVKTGLLNGLGGNKGGVAVGLVLSLTPKDAAPPHRAKAHLATASAPQAPPLKSKASGARGTPIKRSATTPQNLDSSMVKGREISAGFMLSKSSADCAVGIPPPVMSNPYMLHDADGEYGKLLQQHSLPDGNSTGNLFCDDGDTVLENDGVFSPAEVMSRNTSSELTTEHADAEHSHRHTQHSENDMDRQERGDGDDDASSDGRPDNVTPNYMTLLFITAHLTAHQGAVSNRNKDYRQIVYGLQLGRRGPYRKFFKLLLGRKKVLDGDDEEEASDEDDEADYWEDNNPEEGVMPLRLPVVSEVEHKRKMRRDVTEEFDLTLFGGDLNYRINGTRKAIEYVIQHHSNIRSILINNDQLSLERARGKVFQGFQEGNLLFRPTYKYEVSAGGGVTLNEYNFSHKKNRMPAYCDRILYKKRMSSAARRVAIRLYTDVPNVRSSDHRPVVALFDVGTRAYTG
ncbi:endonuclease/exonuclease/phosphatase [Leishmania donovani]|uniref:Endonuclease/exonuclease/phosphatase_-_putative n=3 Tax=Leishmania donovani species complex TaxID=38574 RepID=A0A6L0XRU2_LEIIN|nr:Endonuclease/Exonuclease/phosphatase family protein [Leishmania donovani]CAC9549364.1 endonuclease/exonuclease/phosphatase_-_putative [Leishmania infantum]CAJ1993481.1 endonuclease/exonuclease/phosphatase [Leishmania donovani]SUZ46493.1 endonuclease/exonuclease/phosphatase_-_putative [Leishmania infantum]VDZ49307.1 endonuclease/exonuclease/phosphatase_putative/GeneDB:LmjF.36.1150 [Leishmania donovani]